MRKKLVFAALLRCQSNWQKILTIAGKIPAFCLKGPRQHG